ncbi:MAG: putative bifunctional diguanylate cyclase/phosphodiesterase [Burkholderiaceae bacterium]
MAPAPAHRRDLKAALINAGEGATRWVVLGLVPVGIVLLSLLIFLTLPYALPQQSGQPVALVTSDQHTRSSPPAYVLNALGQSPSAPSMQVNNPAWLLLSLPTPVQDGDIGVEVQAPPARAVTYWNADTLAPIGSVSAAAPSGTVVQSHRRGVALYLDTTTLPSAVLCHADFVDDGSVSARLWNESALYRQLQRHERTVSFLEGGLLAIALFTVLIGLTQKEWIYVVLSAWLIGNLRMVALALGWDTQWLGFPLPVDWLSTIRNVTLAGYYLLTYYLVVLLFRESLGPRLRQPLLLAQWAGLICLAAALTTPDAVFEPVMAVAGIYGSVVVVVLLAKTLRRTRAQRGWMWHVVLFAVALAIMASMASVALMGRTEAGDSFNSALALLAANIMVALTVAKRLREERRRSVRARTALVSNYAMTPIGMFSLSHDGVFQSANPVMEHMLDTHFDGDKVIRWNDYFQPVNWHEVALKTQSGEDVEVQMRADSVVARADQRFVMRALLTPEGIEGSLQDVSARARTIHRMGRLADTDPLTECLNLRGIEKAIEQSLARAREGSPCALVYLNLRHFKRINDLFGHTAGDHVLKLLAQRLETLLESKHPFGRVGGDEFLIILDGAFLDEAQRVGNTIITALADAPFQVGPRAFQLSGVIGIIALNQSMTADDAISAASHACRDARRRKQDIAVYEKDSQALLEHTEELRLFDQIEGSDKPSGLYLDMQPIMNLQDPLGSLSIEVLLRARDPSGMPISSGKFVGSAEDSGTITTLDKWVFSATLEWMDKHQARLAHLRSVHVNLSGVSLNDERFIAALFSILSRHHHLCEKLVVEITEGVALQNLARSRQFIERLASMGVQVALDDFGAGYTSFAYLKELPAQSIKIDGSLIRDMVSDSTNLAIVRAIVQLAQSLNKVCIAEWVEDYATLVELKAMGVDFAQGFVVSRARPPIDILSAQSVRDLVVNRDTLAFIRESYSSP